MNTNSLKSSESWLGRIFASERTLQQVEANADRENPGALHELGVLYSAAHAHTDMDAAARCFRRAAEGGHAPAQTKLALLYLQGSGVARDDQEANRWFAKAAAQGDVCAQYHLGTHYHRKSFGQANGEREEAQIEALKWFLLAAAQNYQNAESSCGSLILQMSHTQMAESKKRAAAFQTGPSPAAKN